MRNLTKTLAVVSLLAPVSGHTLGIGEIKLRSALNQNLDAEIALTLSGESVSDIKVNLAPVEKFDQAGVAWNYFLSKIKFETIAQSNGTTVIKLTSKEALKEPFLDFLLEVSWPKGNLYREFTVLVDPPSVYNQATAPVSTGTESYVQPTAATPQRQSHANGQDSEDEYGPTLGNDTLWSVAERARGQSDVSIEQMMIAIYEANPHAFYKGNVHALMSGKMLRIPEREAVVKLSRNQALAEFNRHTQAWKNHSAPSVHIDAASEKPVDNQLTLLAPTKAAVADRAVVASVNEQTSVKKKAANTSEVVTGKAEASASEAVPTDSAIQSKIAELEKQLAMMQELIALKDQQLAALQNQPRTNPVVQEQAAPEEVVPAKPAAQVTPTPQPTESRPGEVTTVKLEAQVAPTPQPAEPIPNEVVAANPANQLSPVPQQTAAQPPVQPIKPAVQPEPEAGSLFDPYYLGVGGVGSAIFALIGWLWWRKRKVEEETNTESMFASSIIIKVPEADESLSVPLVEDSTTHDVGTIGESSFLSEFTPSDFDSFDTDQGEIDPISEADVYLAYGRYQQAEELIRQAIKDQPNRDECKLKLLEIFYANESKAAFEAYANELVAVGKRNEVDFWEKASEMGREICPDSPLFSFGNDLFAVADKTYVESNDEVKESFEAEQGVIASSTVADKSPGIQIEEIDFDLSSFSMDSKESDEAEQGVIASSIVTDKSSGIQIEEIDFDLSSFSMDSKASDEAEQGVIASSIVTDKSSGIQIEEIDFDLSSFSMDSKESDEAEQGIIASSIVTDKSPGIQIEEIDFDLSSFSLDNKASDEVEQDVIASSTVADKSSGIQIEEIDFDLSSFSMDSKASDEAEQGVIASSIVTDKSSGIQIEEIDFDLSSFSMDSKASDEAEQGVIASSIVTDKSSGIQIEEIDFDLSSFSMDSKESDEAEQGIIASSIVTDKSPGIQIEEIDFDLSSFSLDNKASDEVEQDVIASSTVADKSSGIQIEEIDFDLSSFSMDSKASDEAEQGVIASSIVTDKSSGIQIEEIDFDLSSFSMDSKASDEAEQGVIASSIVTDKSSGIQIEEIDFDLSSFSMDSKTSDEAEQNFTAPSILLEMPSETPLNAKSQEFESYEFNISSNNTDTKETGNIDFSADKTLDFNDDFGSDFDFDFDLDLPLTTSGQYDEFGVSDLTDMDELETKLDLAKAYVDMGDAVAAKDIAKEVLEQGTMEQKKTAQALLDELD